MESDPLAGITDEAIARAAMCVSPAELACTVTQNDKEPFLKPPHIGLISVIIADTIWKGNGRVIVTVPPRHGKSTLLSHWTPVWSLELFPDRFGVVAGYGSDFAQTWGSRVQQSFIEHGPNGTGYLTTRLKEDKKQRAGLWYTQEGGGLLSVGIGGALTGFGGDYIVVDDPIKNEEEANSESHRNSVWGWWQSVARTRLEPGATVVIVLTRWHEDDLAGRLIKQSSEDPDADQWTVIDLPALAIDEATDPLGREEGDPLWPYRYSTPEFEAKHPTQPHPIGRDGTGDWENLNQIKASVGSYWWASMFQCQPSPPGGAIFKREYFRYFRDRGSWWEFFDDPGAPPRRFLKDTCWYFAVIDTAQKTQQIHDFTVLTAFGVTPHKDLFVIRVVAARLEVPDQYAFIKRQAAAIKSQFKIRFRLIGVEDQGSGIGILQVAKRDAFPLKPLKAVVDKVNRAMPVSVFYENGKVFHLEGASWLADFEHELLVFPNGLHDDQVDTVSYGGRVLVVYRSASIPYTHKAKMTSKEELDRDPPSGLDVSAVSSSHRSGLDAYLHRKAKEHGI